jgi:hypothetical protein
MHRPVAGLYTLRLPSGAVISFPKSGDRGREIRRSRRFDLYPSDDANNCRGLSGRKVETLLAFSNDPE